MGPVLERCGVREAPAWVSSRLEPKAGEGLVVFNAGTSVYLSDEDYDALRAGLRYALEPWGDRGLWIELERARGASDGPLELTASRVIDGELRTIHLADFGPRRGDIKLLEGWEFVRAGF